MLPLQEPRSKNIKQLLSTNLQTLYFGDLEQRERPESANPEIETSLFSMGDREEEQDRREEGEELPFPIRESEDDAKMKNINPSVLPVCLWTIHRRL